MDKSEMEIRIRIMIKELAPKGTKFVWGRAKKQFGCCSYRYNRLTGEFFDFKITISLPIASLNTWEEVEKCVIHEIAHARTPRHGHDAVWKKECLALGGDGKRCYTPESRGGVIKQPPQNRLGYKYIGVCICCGKTFPRNRRTMNAYHCNRNYPIKWKLNIGG